jgi:hypothetical protein
MIYWNNVKGIFESLSIHSSLWKRRRWLRIAILS